MVPSARQTSGALKRDLTARETFGNESPSARGALEALGEEDPEGRVAGRKARAVRDYLRMRRRPSGVPRPERGKEKGLPLGAGEALISIGTEAIVGYMPTAE